MEVNWFQTFAVANGQHGRASRTLDERLDDAGEVASAVLGHKLALVVAALDDRSEAAREDDVGAVGGVVLLVESVAWNRQRRGCHEK